MKSLVATHPGLVTRHGSREEQSTDRARARPQLFEAALERTSPAEIGVAVVLLVTSWAPVALLSAALFLFP